MESGTPSDKVIEGPGGNLFKIIFFSYTVHFLKYFSCSTSPGKLSKVPWPRAKL